MPQLQALLAEARREAQARGQATRPMLVATHAAGAGSGSQPVRPAPSGAQSPPGLSPAPSTAALLPPAPSLGLSPAPSTAALLPALPSPPASPPAPPAEGEAEAR